MRIVFIGCVESSYRLLEKLISEHKDVAGVVTKEKSTFNSDFYDLRPLCADNGIPCHCVQNINDEDSLEFMRSLMPDIGFCFGWSQLLKEDALEIFPEGVVGFHPAALPCNRGRHPLIWALALGLHETASSFFLMNAKADEGQIVSQKKVLINYEDNARTLYDKVMDAALVQEIELINAFENHAVQRLHQAVNSGNSWRKRGKADGRIDWRMSSRGIYNLVRSLTRPYVGAHFVHKDMEYKVWKVQEICTNGFENIEPGKVLAIKPDGTVEVKTGENGVRMVDFERVSLNEGDYIL